MCKDYIKYKRGTLERQWTRIKNGHYAWSHYRVRRLKEGWGCYYYGLHLGHFYSMRAAKKCAEQHDNYNLTMTYRILGI